MRLVNKKNHNTYGRLPSNQLIKKGLPGLLLCVFLLAPSLSLAQAAGYAGSFSRIGFGPRGMAMGNAMSSFVEEGIYPYYNPALAAAKISGQQIDFSTSLMSFDRNLYEINTAFPLPANAAISLSLLNASVDDIDGRSQSGYHTGTLSTNEYQLAATVGIRFTSRLHAGVGMKYYLANYHEGVENARTFGFDFGIRYLATDKLNFSLAIKDLLAEYNWDSGQFYGEDTNLQVRDKFPRIIQIGSSYKISDELLVSIEPGLLLASGNSGQSKYNVYQLRTGGRYRIHERITLRAGLQITDLESLKTSNNFSTGFSVHLPFDRFYPSIDYAFVTEPNQISSFHVFGFQLNL